MGSCPLIGRQAPPVNTTSSSRERRTSRNTLYRFVGAYIS